MRATNLSIPTAMYALCAYILMLPLLGLLAAGIWAYKVSGVLFRCTDSFGIIDFIPPFVDPTKGDVYYVPAWRVYLTWFGLIAAVLVSPLIGFWFLWRRWRKEENEGE